MKASEIRIGNLFEYKGNIIKFAIEDFTEADNNSDFLDMLKPIEITEEWITRFGFTSNTFNWSYDDFRISKTGDTYNIGFNGIILLREAKYAHQLQNIYHSLTGKELKIQL